VWWKIKTRRLSGTAAFFLLKLSTKHQEKDKKQKSAVQVLNMVNPCDVVRKDAPTDTTARTEMKPKKTTLAPKTPTTRTAKTTAPTSKSRGLLCCLEILQRCLNAIVILLLLSLLFILFVMITSPFSSWYNYWEHHLWSKIAPANVDDTFSSVSSIFYDVQDEFSSTSPPPPPPPPPPQPQPLPALPLNTSVQWRIPVGCDYSGFFVEGLTYAVGLSTILPNFSIDVGQCGETMLNQLTLNEKNVILSSQNQKSGTTTQLSSNSDILIVHKLPNQNYNIPSKRPKIVIGRQMTEERYLPISEAKQALLMDEIWVPTLFHSKLFEESGIDSKKIFILPEPISTEFYNPERMGKPKKIPTTTIFLSIFKWEQRKGWDVLLKSYWNAFQVKDDVLLIIKTYKPSWLSGEKNILTIISQYAKNNFNRNLSELPKVQLINNTTMSKSDMRSLYFHADAFVLPTRGEGWCLPCVEAMSMNLPILVTNFSGPSSYLSKKYSYPITYQMNEYYAEPNVKSLMQAMRAIVVNPIKAKSKGQKAREYVIQHFSMNVISKKIFNRLGYLWWLKQKSGISGEKRRRKDTQDEL
jgi:glycosyltransferase involved in cell wall biosynthesis